ncbi:hypothetical protein HMPREF1092_03196 [Clostridium thermobutyricum]|uniref:Uncharacterized protein n=1 Tax=Clostridium thermobutyricum TaxID=29372 RepID=N9W8T4_9CLOT|nr:hypothetical protein [Clostridium thermobutyricum]ENY99455.1 hypothetical protein HMPREF1092_03196 [Clostridium thermobutyricum]
MNKIKLCKNKNTGEVIYKDYDKLTDINDNMLIMGDNKDSFIVNFIKELIKNNSSLYIEDKNFSIYKNIKNILEDNSYEVQIINFTNKTSIAGQSIEEFLETKEGKEVLNFCNTRYIFGKDANLSRRDELNELDELKDFNLEIKDKPKVIYIINYSDSTDKKLVSYIRNLLIKMLFKIADTKDMGLENNMQMILDLNIPSDKLGKYIRVDKSRNVAFTLYFEKTELLNFEDYELAEITSNCNIIIGLNKEWYNDKIINLILRESNGDIKDKRKLLAIRGMFPIEIEEL